MRRRSPDGGGTMSVVHARPCLCNSTYISEACCDAADGLVYEPPHFELLPLEEELR